MSSCVLSNPGSKLVSPECACEELWGGGEVDLDHSDSSVDAGEEGW